MGKQKEERVKRPRTYFTKAELVSFGNYMVSAERSVKLLRGRKEQGSSDTNISAVYDADFANWQELNKKS